MNHWPFIIGAYAVTAAGTIGVLVASYVRMRRAERQADALSGRH